MGFFEIFLIGVGLSMDAAAVSATNGMCYKNIKLKNSIVIALAFGIFQGIMPLIGYYAGSIFSTAFARMDHWVVLVLLSLIGGKMLYEALSHKDDGNDANDCKVLTFKLLTLQAVATSIDALAVGVSFVTLSINIFVAVSIIAVTTFILSLVAVYLGKKFGTLLNKKAEMLGGLILIGIGIKIFVEHMWFA